MTELELYKFINDNNIEWHRRDNEGAIDVIVFPSISEMQEFHIIMSESHFDDEGIPCAWKGDYFALWMQDICDYYGIDMDKVFCGEEQ
jgi:hypothetical protein